MKKLATGVLVTLLQAAWGQDAWGQSVDRLLGVLAPAEQTPLTARQQFHDFAMSTVGPVQIFSAAASAGISQWIDSPPEWRQGGSGYARRLGNNLAFNGVRTTLTYGFAASLHEDNRYFGSGRSGFGSRLLYALTSPAIARKDGGNRTVSISSLAGIVGASAISRAWSPPSWQGVDNIGRSIGLTYLGMAGFNVAREFVPDI